MMSNMGYDAFTSNFKDKQGIPHEMTLDLKGSLLEEEAFVAVSPILEQSLGYTTTESGMTALPDSPGDLYPIPWEVLIDDDWSDG